MDTHIPHLRPIVLAGGSGARFWPLSRELTPKQMLTVFGGTSLVTQAIVRVAHMAEAPVVVLTSERLRRELADHVAGIPELDDIAVDIVAEPSARNTAAAIALAAGYAMTLDPDAIIAVLPSDHVLESGQRWLDTMRTASAAAEKGLIVTLGLVPDAPETGYGYISPGEPLPDVENAFLVSRFAEKPDHDTAVRMVADGYLWNSGMVVSRADVLLHELHLAGERAATKDSAHGAVIADAAVRLGSIPPSRWTDDEVREAYDSLPAVQFDRAVLEVSDKVAVVPTALDWSDVGSLLSLACLAEPDERDNVLVGRAYDIDSSGIIAYSADRLLATLGLEDVLVIDTADATLIAAKDRVQDVRLVVDALKALEAPEVVAPRTSVRPWGSWTLLLKGDGFQVKTIEVAAGKRLSLQRHGRRSEHWIIVEGEARVERNGEVFRSVAGESVDVPAESTHRLENPGESVLRVIEVALGDYLGEDDIQRLEDDWSRES